MAAEASRAAQVSKEARVADPRAEKAPKERAKKYPSPTRVAGQSHKSITH